MRVLVHLQTSQPLKLWLKLTTKKQKEAWNRFKSFCTGVNPAASPSHRHVKEWFQSLNELRELFKDQIPEGMTIWKVMMMATQQAEDEEGTKKLQKPKRFKPLKRGTPVKYAYAKAAKGPWRIEKYNGDGTYELASVTEFVKSVSAHRLTVIEPTATRHKRQEMRAAKK